MEEITYKSKLHLPFLNHAYLEFHFICYENWFAKINACPSSRL